MPQVDVFMSEADLESVCGHLFAAGCTIVPDVLSEQPKACELNSLEAFQKWRAKRNTTLFFAVSSDWTVAPFEWGHMNKDDRTQFFIRQKTGGPTLDIFAPIALETASGQTMLPHGFIAFHPTFWNPLTNRNEKSSESLKVMYNRLLTLLRIGADRAKGTNRVYLIAKGAKEMLRTGGLLGPPFDGAVPIPDTRPSR